MTYDWNYWNSLQRPRWPEENGYPSRLAADAQPQRSAMPQFGTAFAPGNLRPPVQPGGPPGMLAPLAAAPTFPQPVSPPSPGYGDFGLLGKGLFPEPPPSSGLLDWVGFGDFLKRNRGGQEPRFARAASRPLWQNPDGGLLNMFEGSDGRQDTTRSDKAAGARAATAMVIAGKGAGRNRRVYPPAQTTFDVGPPTSEAVDLEAMLKAFQFDPNGRGEIGAAIEQTLQDPIYVGNGQVNHKALRARDLSKEARSATVAQFPNVGRRNNEPDAFRHALWSFRMTQDLGPETAKRLSDAHEITYAGPAGELLMDLYNNNAGRQMALDPRNRDRRAEEVILEALREGRLQTGPFSTGHGGEPGGGLQGRILGNIPHIDYVAGTPGRYGRRYGGPR